MTVSPRLILLHMFTRGLATTARRHAAGRQRKIRDGPAQVARRHFGILRQSWPAIAVLGMPADESITIKAFLAAPPAGFPPSPGLPARGLVKTIGSPMCLGNSKKTIVPWHERTMKPQGPVETRDSEIRFVAPEQKALAFPCPTRCRVHGQCAIRQGLGIVTGSRQRRHHGTGRRHERITGVESARVAPQVGVPSCA